MNDTIEKLKEIHECFQNAGECDSAYKEMLPFFENLYEIEESAVSGTHPQSVTEMGSQPATEQGTVAPLLERSDISIDMASAKKVLGIVCETASNEGQKMSQAAAVMKECIADDDPAIQKGIAALLASDHLALQDLSLKLELDEMVFIFFLYHSIWPSLARHVREAEGQNRINPKWSHTCCPVCGSTPNLAFLSDTGKRFLVCGFCRYEWPIKRILCPYCGNDNPESISYSFSEEEKAYRLYTCTECRKYIKTVDTRQLSRSFYAPLESLMTLHLDLHAEAKGFQGGDELYP